MARTLSQYEDQSAARDERPQAQWGWLVAIGIGFLVLSALAFGNLLAATAASVFLVGILMLAGAVAQLVEAFQVRRWGRFFLLLLSAILYGIAGVLAFVNPTLAAAALTLLLAITLVVSGALRLGWGFTLRGIPGRGWIIASGIVSILVGIVFYASWPQNTPWLLGIFLAVDLALQGILLVAFGLGLRSVPR